MGWGTTNLTPQTGLDRKIFGSVEDIYLIYYLCSPGLVSRIRFLCTPNLHPLQTQAPYEKSWNGRKVLHKRSLLTFLSEICSATAMQAYLLSRGTTKQRTPNAKDSLLWFLALRPLPWTSRCHVKSVAIENHRVISLAVQLPQEWEFLWSHKAIQSIFTCKLSLRRCHTRSSYHAWQHSVCSWPDDLNRCGGSVAVTYASLSSDWSLQEPPRLKHL